MLRGRDAVRPARARQARARGLPERLGRAERIDVGPDVRADVPRARAAEADARPNVLFLMSDDMRPDLGCYGNLIVKSPNLDALAARGVRFERAYCQYALCNPSRTSLLSGRRPEVTNIMDNGTPPRTFLGEQAVFLPEYFGRQGYFTARVGKIAHPAFEKQLKWDVAEDAKGRNRERGKLHQEGSAGALVGWLATDNDDADEDNDDAEDDEDTGDEDPDVIIDNITATDDENGY